MSNLQVYSSTTAESFFSSNLPRGGTVPLDSVLTRTLYATLLITLFSCTRQFYATDDLPFIFTFLLVFKHFGNFALLLLLFTEF